MTIMMINDGGEDDDQDVSDADDNLQVIMMTMRTDSKQMPDITYYKSIHPLAYIFEFVQAFVPLFFDTLAFCICDLSPDRWFVLLTLAASSCKSIPVLACNFCSCA